jgi:murein hydrolase activator
MRADRIFLALALLLGSALPCAAQFSEALPAPANAETRLKDLEQQLQKSRAEHEEKKRRAREVTEETTRIRSDMVASARAAQESEELLSDLEGQLEELKTAESDRSEALKRRSAQMTRVLTALQRLAWRPTEALIAQPQTPADTVRSAILLRASVPQIERSVRDLRGEIEMLSHLRNDIVAQRKKITNTTAKLEAEHGRLTDLYERKAQVQTQVEAEKVAAEQRMDVLANQAGDLRDLLSRLEEERQRRVAEATTKAAAERAAREAEANARREAVAAEQAAQKAAHEAEIATRKAEKEQHEREMAQAQVAREADMRAQAAAREKELAAQKATRDAEIAAAAATAARPVFAEKGFSAAQGKMPYPARGKVIEQYGQTNDVGHVMKGITIQTRRDAQVIAPYDGQVAFSGPFRGYGLLLIIEHSEGYHTLLAGMARIDVAVGQRLLAGEPVGVMGQDDTKPALYVELRRNGQPVNPLPWLSAQKSKVTG